MQWLTDRRLLLAALLAWITVAVLGLVIGPSLGHDESAFTIAAQGAAPGTSWLYRSVGTVAIAKVGLALGGAAWQLRLPSVVLGTSIVVAVFAVGRAAFTARTGAWAAALIAGAHPMVLRSAELLSDLPAAAGILGGIAIVIGELDRHGGPRWRIVGAAPLFAAAFYIRYGSAPVIALAIAAAGILWWRVVVARPLRVLAMVAALAVLLIPHILHSLDATGTMLGILKASASRPRRAYLGEGLVTYLTSNPFMFYGFLIAPVAIAGLLGLLQLRRKAPWYLAIVAIAQVISLGVESHGQPRYVFVATALFVVLGVDRLAHFDRPRLAFGLVATSWVAVIAVAVLYYRYLDDARAPILDAARTIRRDTGDRPCTVIALNMPQLMLHTGCDALTPQSLSQPLPADHNHYAVTFTRWPIDLASVVAAQHAQATPLPTTDPRTTVWLLH